MQKLRIYTSKYFKNGEKFMEKMADTQTITQAIMQAAIEATKAMMQTFAVARAERVWCRESSGPTLKLSTFN